MTHPDTLPACHEMAIFYIKAGHATDERGCSPMEPIKTVPDPVHGSSLDQATRPKRKGGAPPPPTIMAIAMAIASALSRLPTATAAPSSPQ